MMSEVVSHCLASGEDTACRLKSLPADEAPNRTLVGPTSSQRGPARSESAIAQSEAASQLRYALSAPEVDAAIHQLSPEERARAYKRLNALVRAQKFIYREPEASLFNGTGGVDPEKCPSAAMTSEPNRKRRFETVEEEVLESKRIAGECERANCVWSMCGPDTSLQLTRRPYAYIYDAMPMMTSAPNVCDVNMMQARKNVCLMHSSSGSDAGEATIEQPLLAESSFECFAELPSGEIESAEMSPPFEWASTSRSTSALDSQFRAARGSTLHDVTRSKSDAGSCNRN